LLVANETLLARRVQTGLCDAGLVEAPLVGRFVAARRARFGPIAGRIRTEAAFAAGVERGDPLRAELDVALRRLAADGTLARLRRVWLGGDPAALPVLR
jgi:ABC-type amino acid transport substrate-binding protein